MFVFVRALTYSTLFIGLVLVYVPARLLSWSGLVRPVAMEVQQVVGMVIGAAGSALALWCIFTFASVGKGTPAPFDPPRRLVIRGPYRFVRNPMYIGAGLALAGAALFDESPSEHLPAPSEHLPSTFRAPSVRLPLRRRPIGEKKALETFRKL